MIVWAPILPSINTKRLYDSQGWIQETCMRIWGVYKSTYTIFCRLGIFLSLTWLTEQWPYNHNYVEYEKGWFLVPSGHVSQGDLSYPGGFSIEEMLCHLKDTSSSEGKGRERGKRKVREHSHREVEFCLRTTSRQWDETLTRWSCHVSGTGALTCLRKSLDFRK